MGIFLLLINRYTRFYPKRLPRANSKGQRATILKSIPREVKQYNRCTIYM